MENNNFVNILKKIRIDMENRLKQYKNKLLTNDIRNEIKKNTYNLLIDHITPYCFNANQIINISEIEIIENNNLLLEVKYNLPDALYDILKESKNGWQVTSIKCDICTHEYISVHPVGTPRLECPNCHYYIEI